MISPQHEGETSNPNFLKSVRELWILSNPLYFLSVLPYFRRDYVRVRECLRFLGTIGLAPKLEYRKVRLLESLCKGVIARVRQDIDWHNLHTEENKPIVEILISPMFSELLKNKELEEILATVFGYVHTVQNDQNLNSNDQNLNSEVYDICEQILCNKDDRQVTEMEEGFRTRQEDMKTYFLGQYDKVLRSLGPIVVKHSPPEMIVDDFKDEAKYEAKEDGFKVAS